MDDLVTAQQANDGLAVVTLNHPPGNALDVETGICVAVDPVGGGPPFARHDVTIHEVDAEHPEAFFAPRRPPCSWAAPLRSLRR